MLTLDLPSNGSLCADASPASVNGLLHAVRLQINDRGTELPVNVLAMSLGGMVATHWAQHYPHEVARRVLINTSMRPFSGLAERLRPGSWIPLAKLALHWGRTSHVEEIKSAIHRLTCKQTAYRASDLAQWSHIRRSAPVSAANVLRQLWAAARFTCNPAPPACPVLVLSSKRDDPVNPVCSTLLARAWLLPHHKHPWAGHDLPHDDVPWVCERVLAWLSNE